VVEIIVTDEFTEGRTVMAQRWNQIKHKASAAQRAESKQWAKEEAARLEAIDADLKAMRELLGKTQTEVAEAMDVSQSRISEAEHRDDHLLSTLRAYVEALGGELELIANFGDKRIRLHGV
jgi:DNA-directed RNA polymerase specialized sigma subunit